MPKVASVAEAMRKQAAKLPRGGPSVRVRAIKDLQYGYPIASMKHRGDEFNFRLADLRKVEDLVDLRTKKPYKAGDIPTDYTGKPIGIIEANGVRYALPTSVEDATLPSSLIEPKDEDDEDGVTQAGEM